MLVNRDQMHECLLLTQDKREPGPSSSHSEKPEGDTQFNYHLYPNNAYSLCLQLRPTQKALSTRKYFCTF
jgi:hypothetical protein